MLHINTIVTTTGNMYENLIFEGSEKDFEKARETSGNIRFLQECRSEDGTLSPMINIYIREDCIEAVYMERASDIKAVRYDANIFNYLPVTEKMEISELEEAAGKSAEDISDSSTEKFRDINIADVRLKSDAIEMLLADFLEELLADLAQRKGISLDNSTRNMMAGTISSIVVSTTLKIYDIKNTDTAALLQAVCSIGGYAADFLEQVLAAQDSVKKLYNKDSLSKEFRDYIIRTMQESANRL